MLCDRRHADRRPSGSGPGVLAACGGEDTWAIRAALLSLVGVAGLSHSSPAAAPPPLLAHLCPASPLPRAQTYKSFLAAGVGSIAGAVIYRKGLVRFPKLFDERIVMLLTTWLGTAGFFFLIPYKGG